MWNYHVANMGKKHSAAGCWLQHRGYSFSLARLFDSDDEQQVFLDQQPQLHTKAAFILLALSIVSMGIAILAFLHGIMMMVKQSRRADGVKQEIPLNVLRIAFFACTVSTILRTISAAKITASADQSAGRYEVDTGIFIYAWTHSGFLAITWVSTVLMWLALGLVVITAFRAAAMLKREEVEVAGAERRWYCL